MEEKNVHYNTCACDVEEITTSKTIVIHTCTIAPIKSGARRFTHPCLCRGLHSQPLGYLHIKYNTNEK